MYLATNLFLTLYLCMYSLEGGEPVTRIVWRNWIFVTWTFVFCNELWYR